MPVYDFKLRLISPAFIAGTDKKKPEMRAASIRGQLRYWLRAWLGASTTLDNVWKRESDVFGSTSKGSAVSIRIYGKAEVEKLPMLPHREGSRENVSAVEALKAEQNFRLQLVTRPGVDLLSELPDAITALKLWSLLGGIGRRSRRMMGAVEVQPRDGFAWYPKYRSPEELAAAIVDTLQASSSTSLNIPKIPAFPILHPDHSWIIIGAAAKDYKEANQTLFRDFLRNDKFRPHQDAFGYAKGNKRRASPIHAQVRKIGSDYYPIITAFRSNPLDKADYAKVIHDFMTDACKEHVWGGW